MASDLTAALRLEVPLIVQLGERSLTVSEVVGLFPGAIIELSKNAEDELDLLVNNKQIGTGSAVKVGENFGIRINYLGDIRTRIAALGQARSHESAGPESSPIPEPEAAAQV